MLSDYCFRENVPSRKRGWASMEVDDSREQTLKRRKFEKPQVDLICHELEHMEIDGPQSQHFPPVQQTETYGKKQVAQPSRANQFQQNNTSFSNKDNPFSNSFCGFQIKDGSQQGQQNQNINFNSSLFPNSSGMVPENSHRTIDENPIFQIFVKNLTGKTLTIACKATDTVSHIKQLISDREGNQELGGGRLLWAGKQLQDQRSLYFYNIHNEATLFLVWRLPGG